MAKKGSLELSVNSIVILVLAITMLGLGLSFIRGMFGKGTEKLGDIMESTDLEDKPTADNPITIPTKVQVVYGGSKEMQVGFYNAQRRVTGTAQKALLNISSCLSETGEVEVLPSFRTPATDVPPSESVGFKAILDLSDTTIKGNYTAGNTYICTLDVASQSNGQIYDSTQFYLQVTS